MNQRKRVESEPSIRGKCERVYVRKSLFLFLWLSECRAVQANGLGEMEQCSAMRSFRSVAKMESLAGRKGAGLVSVFLFLFTDTQLAPRIWICGWFLL
ncbi:hypothetical protein DL95DRAFT_383008 [Leptodontidium sp. 2 PMI_412]|nr:hypothetical protein DL95DRAFT_383008 [Leptodontidium sp. 2 PMI_412]